MKTKFLLMTFLCIFFISGCTSNKQNSAVSSKIFGEETELVDKSEKSTDSSFVFDKDNFTFSTDGFEFTDFKVESFKDIDDADSIFIYSTFKNKSSEELIPDSIWQQYVAISIDKEGIQDSLYPTVLPEKLLDDSDYKTAIDNSLTSVKKDESKKIGYFYKNDGKAVKMTIYDNDRNIVAIINKIK